MQRQAWLSGKFGSHLKSQARALFFISHLEIILIKSKFPLAFSISSLCAQEDKLF